MPSSPVASAPAPRSRAGHDASGGRGSRRRPRRDEHRHTAEPRNVNIGQVHTAAETGGYGGGGGGGRPRARSSGASRSISPKTCSTRPGRRSRHVRSGRHRPRPGRPGRSRSRPVAFNYRTPDSSSLSGVGMLIHPRSPPTTIREAAEGGQRRAGSGKRTAVTLHGCHALPLPVPHGDAQCAGVAGAAQRSSVPRERRDDIGWRWSSARREERGPNRRMLRAVERPV